MERLKFENKDKLEQFAQQKSKIRRLWNVAESSAELLYMLILIRQAKNILEIGTSNGYSTFWLSKAAEQTGGKVDSIEVDKKRWEMAVDNLADCVNVKLHFAKAEDILAEFGSGIDFVFIDAGKPGYIDYLKLIEDKLADQAVIVADNIISHPDTTSSFRAYIENSEQYISGLINLDAGLLLSYFQRTRQEGKK